MKIGPYELVRAAETPVSVEREIGASGTINMDGFIQPHDYNSELVGRAGLFTWERMRRSDSAVREALWHIFTPILAANWVVEPASSEPLDLEVAEFGRRAFFEWLLEPWSQVLRTGLLYLPQGFQVFEMVEQVVEAELTYDVPLGPPVTVPSRQFVTWRRFAHRRPETIFRWVTENGELQSIQQLVPGAVVNDTPTIPANKIVLLINEKEGDEWTGTSILRSAYKAWRLKEIVEKTAGMSFEKYGLGIPIGYLPESLRNDDNALARLEEMLRDFRAGQYSYMAFPGPKAATGVDGYTVEILTPSGAMPDPMPFLLYLRGDIKGNVLARFSELGHGLTGARAVGDVQAQIWYDALQSTANHVAEVFTGALRGLVDRNYQVEQYPSLRAQDIQARSLTEFADATSKLVASGAVIADKSFRTSVREFMNWPDEDEAEAAPTIEEDPTADPSQNGVPEPAMQGG